MGIVWLGIVVGLYFGCGIAVGIILSLFIGRYRGPPVRWEFEEKD